MQYQNFSIEKASNRDVLEIKNLIFKVLAEYRLPIDENGVDADLYDIEENYAYKSRVGFWVVRNKKNIILGTCALGKHSEKEAEIRKLYFDKSLRGKGLGKYLVNFLVARAKEWNYDSVVLETATSMKEAIGLYQKLGFRAYEDFPTASRCDRAFKLDL